MGRAESPGLPSLWCSSCGSGLAGPALVVGEKKAERRGAGQGRNCLGLAVAGVAVSVQALRSARMHRLLWRLLPKHRMHRLLVLRRAARNAASSALRHASKRLVHEITEFGTSAGRKNGRGCGGLRIQDCARQRRRASCLGFITLAAVGSLEQEAFS